jgi:hypothetical protein
MKDGVALDCNLLLNMLSIPRPGPLVRRGAGDLFCWTITQGNSFLAALG